MLEAARPTTEIASAVIADLSASDAAAAGDVAIDTPEAHTEAPAAGATPAAETLTTQTQAQAQTVELAKPTADDDDFEKVPERDARGREHRLPHSRVKTMIAKAREKAAKEAEGKYADYSALQQQVAHMQAAERLMIEQPEVFLQAMAGVNPEYRRFLQPTAQSQTPQTPQQGDQHRPGPDFDLGNGQRTYSQAGLERLMAYERQQAVKEAEQRMMRELAPIRERHQTEQLMTAAVEKVRGTLAEARQWPGFTDSEAEIVSALKANPKMSLDAAYRQVVLPRFTADRNKLREELLKELKQAPASTTAPTTTAGSTAEPKARSTADIARSVMASLKA